MGGSWLFGIVALFIVLFSGFMAYSISYTKAFNTKNQIINFIERNEGFSCSTKSVTNSTTQDNEKSTEGKIYNYIKQVGYNTESVNCNKEEQGNEMKGSGYCLKKQDNGGKANYKVTTFIKLTIPVVNIQIRIPISGETKALYYDSGKDKCY